MTRARGLLAGELQFFEELLAGTQSRKYNVHFFEGLQSRQPDHFHSHVEDAHRLAHIKNEDLSPLAHGAGLEDQLGGFPDRHEISPHVRVSHSHWATPPNLLAKDRNHGTVR